MLLNELDENEMQNVDGGVAVSVICVVASGICYVEVGIASLTGHDKISAALTMAGACCDVAAGVAILLPKIKVDITTK